MLYRYVNTDVSPGGDGSAGDPYASLSEAEAENLNLVTATDSVTIFCSGSKVDTTGVYFLGWTTSSSYQIIIQGNRTTGAWDTARYSLTVASGIVLQFGVAYVTARNLQLSSDDPVGYPCVEIWSAPAGDYTVERNLIRYRGAGAYDSGVTCRAASGTVYVRNNFIYGFGGTTFNRGIYARDATLVYADNNTIIDCGNGIDAFDSSPTIAARNNITQGCTNDYVEPGTAFDTANCGYNLTDSATSPPGSTGNVTSTSLQFVNAANDDYQLHVSDVAAIGAGVDRSSLFSDDLNGNTRYTWDIGAHAYIVPEAITKDRAAAIIRRPWTKQAAIAAGIDWSHPLAQGLVSFPVVYQGRVYDLATGRNFDITLSGSDYSMAVSNGYGDCIKASDTTATHYAVVNADASEDFFPERIFNAITQTYWVALDPQTQTWDQVVIYEAASADSAEIGFRLSQTWRARFYLHRDSWNTITEFESPVTNVVVGDSKIHAYSGVWNKDKNSGSMEYYRDGDSYGLSVATQTVACDTTQSSFYNRTHILCQKSDGTSQTYRLQGEVPMWCFHDRDLSPAEVESLHRNPWQIFKPQTIHIGKPEARRVVTF